MEIERKFLIEKEPDLNEVYGARVYQGYLPDETPVRIRKFVSSDGEERFELTIKGKGTLVRAEVNLELTAAQYDELSGLLQKPPVEKDYHVYQLADGHRLEYNVVDRGKPNGFTYAEVEFSSEEEASSFVPPEYFGREVTENPSMTMFSYWRNGKIDV